MNTIPVAPPSGAAGDALAMDRMEEARLKLAEALPQFTDVIRKLEKLEENRKKGEETFTTLLRCIAAEADVPESAASSASLGDLDSMRNHVLAFLSKTLAMKQALEALKGAAALATEATAAKRGEEPPGGFTGLGEIANARGGMQYASLLDRGQKLADILTQAGLKDTKGVKETWNGFLAEVRAVREAALALPGARGDDVLRDWGLGLDEATSLPDGYRMLDTEEAELAVRGRLRAVANAFSNAVAAADAVQPPFEKIDASSMNVSSSFPSQLVVGRIASFPPKNDGDLQVVDIPKTMPRCVDFPFTTPLVYEDGDLLQMIVLRLAQALPQGLFEVYVLDSENVGQTFREIAGLRKAGILTVSAKKDDDERILSELDAWLGDLSDRGCWDDSVDWANYNRKHQEAPLPFKFVIFPSFVSLDAHQLSTVAKLAKNGAASGIVIIVSQTAMSNLDERDGESAAKTLSKMRESSEETKLFVSLESLVANDENEEEVEMAPTTEPLDARLTVPTAEARPYEPAPLDAIPRPAGNFNLTVGPVYVKDQMLRIANAEGPITEKLLFARVLAEWGFQSATENRLKVLKKSIPAELPVTEHLGEKTYWPVGADPSAWHYYRVPGASPSSHRTFGQIPPEEIAAAIMAEHHASSGDKPMDDYVPGALGRLGLPRTVTPDMRGALDAAKRLARGSDN